MFHEDNRRGNGQPAANPHGMMLTFDEHWINSTMAFQVKLHAILAALIVVATVTTHTNANAQSGRPYKLDWDVPGEELVYRPCGCADLCWVAEVRSVKNMSVKATLRCDCEKLHFGEPNGSESVVARSCDDFNGDGKTELIRERVRELMTQPKRQAHRRKL